MFSIILPTYNEKDNIGWMLSTIEECMKEHQWEVIIIDDNSPDDTYNITYEYIQKATMFDKVKLFKRTSKQGLGTAYKLGMKYASGEWIILMDADRSHHPKYIQNMIYAQKQYDADIVNASRYAKGGGVIGWPWHRKFISLTANTLARIMLQTNRSDMTGSFRLYKKNILTSILSNIKSTGYAFQMETIIKAERMGYKIVDVPFLFTDRTYGESKLGFKEIIGFILAIIMLLLQSIQSLFGSK